MDSDQSGAVGQTIWGLFQGSLTHLGTSARLQSQIQAILWQILTFPDPPCQLGQIFRVSNGSCPTHIITYFMLDLFLVHLLRNDYEKEISFLYKRVAVMRNHAQYLKSYLLCLFGSRFYEWKIPLETNKFWAHLDL